MVGFLLAFRRLAPRLLVPWEVQGRTLPASRQLQLSYDGRAETSESHSSRFGHGTRERRRAGCRIRAPGGGAPVDYPLRRRVEAPGRVASVSKAVWRPREARGFRSTARLRSGPSRVSLGNSQRGAVICTNIPRGRPAPCLETVMRNAPGRSHQTQAFDRQMSLASCCGVAGLTVHKTALQRPRLIAALTNMRGKQVPETPRGSGRSVPLKR